MRLTAVSLTAASLTSDSSGYSAESEESLNQMEEDIPGTPTPEDFNYHFSYPNSPSELSPLAAGLPTCPLITYADVVSGRVYTS